MSVAIAAQPAPSAGVAAFLRRPPRLLIGGEWVQPAARDRIPVIDPATGEEVASIADASRADVDKAVAAAREAFERGPWTTMLPAQREALIWRLADLIDKNADELAELESIDN
ncbi:MAG TPA: aldehyde dehydrogenase family protein, partial [Gammaproteobacteria bacterium]